MLGKFFRNSAFMTLAEFFARAKGILILPLLARYLGSADFGVWSQVTVLVFTLTPLVTLGSESGVMRHLPGIERAQQARQFSAWLLMIAAGSAVAASALLAFGDSFGRAFFGTDAAYQRFIPLAAASLVATMLASTGRTWLFISGKGRRVALAAGIQAVLTVAATAATVALDGGVRAVIGAGIAADLATGAGLVVMMAADGALVRPDFSMLGRVIRFGLPLVPGAYAMWALNWIDRLFLVHYRTLSEIGAYAVAYGIAYTVVQVVTNPIWAMYPSSVTELFNRADHDGVSRLLHAAGGTIMGIAIPSVAGLWALDVPIITLVAGESYASAALVMPLVALGYFFLMLFSFGSVAVGLANRQYLSALALVSAALVNVGLNILWIPAYGIIGAAAATAAGLFVPFALVWIFARAVGPFWRDAALPAKIVLAALAMAAATRLLDREIALPAALRLAILVPTGMGLYALAALVLGVLPARLTVRSLLASRDRIA